MNNENNLNNNQVVDDSSSTNIINSQTSVKDLNDISMPSLNNVEEPTQLIPTLNSETVSNIVADKVLNQSNINQESVVTNDMPVVNNVNTISTQSGVVEVNNVGTDLNNNIGTVTNTDNSLVNNQVVQPVVQTNEQTQINNNQSMVQTVETIQPSTVQPVVQSVESIELSNNQPVIQTVQQVQTSNVQNIVENNNNLVSNTSTTNVNSSIQDNVSVPTTPNDKDKKKINKNLIIIIGIVLGILVIGIVLVVLLSGKGAGNKTNDLGNQATAFFLKDKNDEFSALFDVDGNKLTDFIFKDYSYIKNGSAKVEDKDGNYGIIAANGKMIVDFGKYEDIDQQDTLYEVTDKDGNDYLLNSKGKVIMSLEDSYLETFITDSDYYYYLLETNTEYMVLNYNGETITKFNIVEDADDPSLSSEDPYIVVFYNDTNYLIDLEKNKVVTTFKEDKLFCINDLNENNNEILFNYCVGMFESKEENHFKYMKDNKIVFELDDSECSSLTFDDGNNILCHKDYDDVILNKSNGQEKFVTNSYEREISYIDDKNYMVETEEIDKLEIYVDGSLKTTIDGFMRSREYVYQGLYLVENHEALLGNDEYRFYKKDGTLLNNEVYLRAEGFDKFGRAVVSKESGNYYLIDTKGTKLSNDYSYISGDVYEYYYASDKDNNRILLDVNGKELFAGEYIYLYKHKGTMYAKVKKDEKYSLYNLDTNKLLFTEEKDFDIYDVDYIQVSYGESIKYYTFKGKMFYES